MNMSEAMADFQSLKLHIAHMEGRRDSVIKEYEKNMGYLKALEKNSEYYQKIDAALVRAQQEASGEAIARYSSLLSAIATDILGEKTDIGMELSVDRGLPALDVFLAHKNGKKIDIVEGCGGSLSNIISVGLRLIALTTSGKRQFLALDEPDCWLSPLLVPDFFRVLEGVADGAQIVVITHHDVSSVSEATTVLELRGGPEQGLSVKTIAAAPWREGAPGIRELILENHSSFKAATIPLGPGLTIIKGRNNIGKSRIIRALRNVFYAESDDGDIRNGEMSAQIQVVFNEGMRLRWQRQQKKSPATKWSLTDANGKPVLLRGAECAGGGRQAPEWLAEATGIAKLDGLDVQIGHQKTPIFLLDKPSTQRAAVLSVGSEAGILRDMAYLNKEDATENKHELKYTNETCENILHEISAMQRVAQIRTSFSALETTQENLVKTEKTLQDMETLAKKFSVTMSERDTHKKLIDATQNIPDPQALPDKLRGIATLTKSALTWRAMVADKANQKRTFIRIFANMPAQAPIMQKTADMVGLVISTHDAQEKKRAFEKIVKATDALIAPPAKPDAAIKMISDVRGFNLVAESLKKEQAALSDIKQGLLSIQNEIESLMNKIGHVCPVCHTPGIHANHIVGALN